MGKGGGRDSFAQGSGTLNSGLEQAVEQFERYILALLKIKPLDSIRSDAYNIFVKQKQPAFSPAGFNQARFTTIICLFVMFVG